MITKISPQNWSELAWKMSLIAQRKDLDIKEVIKYELGLVAWSLPNNDGILRKPNKSEWHSQ